MSPALQVVLQATVLLAVPAALLHFNKNRKMYARFVGSSSPQEERLITIRVERHEMLAIEKLRTKQLEAQIGSGLLDTPGIPARDRVHEARTMVFTDQLVETPFTRRTGRMRLHHHQQAFTPATEGDSAKAGG